MSELSDNRILRALWFSRSIRTQLLLVFVLVEATGALIAGGLTIYRAGAATRAEISASMMLAEVMANDAVQLVGHGVPEREALQTLPAQLRFARHVRVEIKNAAGMPLEDDAGNSRTARSDARTQPPAWFASLIRPAIESRDIPVTVGGQSIGSVRIISEPADEIAEVWENTVALGTVALAMSAALIGILYLALGRVLEPLTTLSAGFGDLERRQYHVRLARPQLREFAAITDRFNALAAALDSARGENLELNRRVITAQDDERRRTALELHDEVGPSLFGLKANATSIVKAAEALPPDTAGAVRDRARDLLAIVEHLQSTNRSILQRLRPMALGHVPLTELLSELVQDRARQHTGISFRFSAQNLVRGYGDSIDLTLYRCIQEGLTNAIRHGEPKEIDVEVMEIKEPETRLRLLIRDDGSGFQPDGPQGFGLQGMRERVQGLGGEFSVESAPPRGTCLRIHIPVRADNIDNPAGRGTVTR